MHDYAIKLHEGIREASTVMSHSALALLAMEATLLSLREEGAAFDYLLPNFERASYEKLPKLVPITFNRPQRLVVLTNSLAQRRYEMVKLIVTTLKLRLTDERGNDVPFQVSWLVGQEFAKRYEVLFFFLSSLVVI